MHVLIPKGKYNGQKLIKLVSTNTLAKASNTIPNVPGITFVKNRIAMTAAIINRIILSAFPIFVFIM